MQKVTSFNPSNKLNSSHRKENHFQEEFSIIAFDGTKFSAPITCRTYGTQAKNYCCLWIHGQFKGIEKYVSVSGSGSAGGYGYHRPSAAAQEAINGAGFNLAEAIDGRGDSAIEDALKAIAEYLGIKNYYLHKANA